LATLLARVGDPFRNAVVEDRFLLPLQRYPTEPCDQWFPAFAFDGDVPRIRQDATWRSFKIQRTVKSITRWPPP
jgi:hypothetical protein